MTDTSDATPAPPRSEARVISVMRCPRCNAVVGRVVREIHYTRTSHRAYPVDTLIREVVTGAGVRHERIQQAVRLYCYACGGAYRYDSIGDRHTPRYDADGSIRRQLDDLHALIESYDGGEGGVK